MQYALPFTKVAQVAFAAHGILAQGFAISQFAPVNPRGHTHVYEVVLIRIHVPPFRHGVIVPEESTHGSPISQ